MRRQVSRPSALTIAVFYPNNSLMHQVSEFAGEDANCKFRFVFPVSVGQIREALGPQTVSIVDATEDPARAATVLIHTLAEAEPGSAAVYTETMHNGLELFVRSRGALLLLGPLDNSSWKGLIETMTRGMGQVSGPKFPTWREIEQDADLAATGLLKYRVENSAQKRFRRIA